MSKILSRAAALAALGALPAIPAAAAPIETVVVTGIAGRQPNSVEHVSAHNAKAQINTVNTEDMLKYAPSLMVRKRHYGDTQDPIATRTSGVGASARSLIFVDGVGVGRRDAAVNPLARVPSLLSHFADGTGELLPRDAAVARVDACLGIAGRPQSATGQATLFTGVNAAAHLGQHLHGFPNAKLRQLLAARTQDGR